MPPAALDGIILLLVLGVGYALASEGLWGAALMTLNILFAGPDRAELLRALAAIIAENVEFLSGFADTMSLLGVFTVALIGLRIGTESLAPAMVRFPGPVYFLGDGSSVSPAARWSSGSCSWPSTRRRSTSGSSP
jgi:hypothetical protein